MPKHLFPRFLIDAEEYSRARQFWKDMCEEVLQHSLSKDIWHEWFNTKAADGTELKDGNPIFSLVCERQAKGVSIHQEPLDEHQSKVAIYARLREFGSNSLQQPIAHLLIGCELSEESAAIARKLIQAWIDEGMTTVKMERLIRASVPD